MTENSQSGLAFTLFKAQSNTDFKDLIKVLPQENRYLSFPSYIKHYVTQMLDKDIKGTDIKEIVDIVNVTPNKDRAVLIIITTADRDTVDTILTIFEGVPNYTKALLLIPRNTAYVQQVFENHNFIATQNCPQDPTKEIYTQEFHADFLPIDNDFLLMPCINSFYQINVENDFNDLHSSARCLAKIQMVFGTIPQIFTLGSSAERVRDLMQGIISQTGSSTATAPQIDSLIIIDRSVDLITPLMSSFCQEGVIDELFGINYGVLETPQTLSTEIKEIVLNENDDLFQTTRYLPISQAGDQISAKISEFKDIEAKLKASKPTEFKDNYYKMKNLVDSKPHFCLLMDLTKAVIEESTRINPILKIMLQKEFDLVRSSTPIIDTAENFITIFDDWMNALRLIFLESLVGISHSKGTIQKIEKEIVSEFGVIAHESLITLEKLKLISSSPYLGWSQISKAIGVFKDDKMSVLCDQFVPVTVRAVQRATVKDWPGTWGKSFEERKVPVSVVGEPSKPIDGEVRRILVFFVGGVTLSEAAYIRQLGKVMFDGQVQYIVGSTDAINKNKFMKQLCPDFF